MCNDSKTHVEHKQQARQLDVTICPPSLFRAAPSDLMSSYNDGQMPYKERLQRTLTQQDENVVLLLKNTRTISDTAVENVFATQEKMRKESDRSGEEKVERPGRTRRRTGGGED